MNRKEAIFVTVIIFGTLITGAFADTLSTSSPTRTTVQTASVDIQVLDATGVGIYTPAVNFTSGFSFNPQRSFVQVNSVLITIFYSFAGGTPISGSLTVRLNGIESGVVSYILQNSVITTGTLSTQGLRVGANQIAISSPTGVVIQVFQIRLTVEYTFLGWPLS